MARATPLLDQFDSAIRRQFLVILTHRNNCDIALLGNRTLGNDLVFDRFPADDERKKLWAVRVKRSKEDGSLWMPNSHRLCSVSNFP